MEAAAKEKAEARSRIALEESCRDAIKKENDKVALLGGGAVVAVIAIFIISMTIGDKIASTTVAHILMALMVVLIIVAVVLIFYSRILTKEYESAKRRVDELKKEL